MQHVIGTVGRISAAAWRIDRGLTLVVAVMLAALVGSAAGLWLDPRLITGAPAWLKPAKFAASIAIYVATLIWIFSYLPDWPRTRRIAGRVTAVVMLLEFVIIALQAWRGTTSHFNFGTPLDGALFMVMGASIAFQTVTSIAVLVALWRTRFADAALGWALRLGLAVTIAGAFTGGLMTRPTEAQLAEARAGAPMTVVGAHTVGAPDGGPGLPGTNWSREHGDLRVPHFIGLHAVQVLPLLALVLRRRIAAVVTRVRLTAVAAGSYATLFALLLWQALRGQSLIAPDAMTVTALAAWMLLTALAMWWAAGRRPRALAISHAMTAH